MGRIMQEKLTMKYDPLTIQHFGVSLYSNLPTVLSELIANAYDADSSSVTIEFEDDNKDKRIIVHDDGDGMSFEELNDKYLTIGRNRRMHNNDSKTRKGRKVIGKKGLGKLSVFGICRKIIVETTDTLGVTNSFSMDIDKILQANGGEYHPEIILLNKQVSGKKSGTKIILERVKRKTKFDLDEIKSQLSRKFSIFDVLETYIGLSDDLCLIKNEDKFDDLEVQFKWDFPTEDFGTEYENWNKIHGTLIATRKPLKDPKMKGVYLTSRGKIVNEAELYGRKDDRWFGTYFTGFLAVDFIDDYDKELISTNRCSLVWDEDETIELRDYLNHVLMKVEGEWNKKRNAENSAALKRDKGIDIDQFIEKLPTYQQDLAQKIIYPIMDSPQIESEKSSKIISGVVDKFGNEDFRRMASDVVEAATNDDIPKFMDLLDEWKITEMHNMSALATSRVSIINNFEKMLNNDTKEVPTMHNFIKKFSWLLDPRLLELKDEVRYSVSFR